MENPPEQLSPECSILSEENRQLEIVCEEAVRESLRLKLEKEAAEERWRVLYLKGLT
jgi:hypothetical protein